MNNIISPIINNDYVTKKEFSDFRVEMRGFQASTEASFDGIESKIVAMDTKFSTQISEINMQIGELRESVNMQILELSESVERHTGMVYEQMQHYMKAALEQVKSWCDKKVDKEEFYEYRVKFERGLAKKLKY